MGMQGRDWRNWDDWHPRDTRDPLDRRGRGHLLEVGAPTWARYSSEALCAAGIGASEMAHPEAGWVGRLVPTQHPGGYWSPWWRTER